MARKDTSSKKSRGKAAGRLRQASPRPHKSKEEMPTPRPHEVVDPEVLEEKMEDEGLLESGEFEVNEEPEEEE